jgi:putative mycofactocin binding protein MftB
MNGVVDLAARYRLAPGVAIRPERFGGLVYRYDNRRLYFLRSHQAVEFVSGLDGGLSLREALDEFLSGRESPGSARDTLVKTVERLEQLGILTSAIAYGVGYSRG